MAMVPPAERGHSSLGRSSISSIPLSVRVPEVHREVDAVVGRAEQGMARAHQPEHRLRECHLVGKAKGEVMQAGAAGRRWP